MARDNLGISDPKKEDKTFQSIIISFTRTVLLLPQIQNILPLRHRFQAPLTTNTTTTSWSLQAPLLLLNSTENLISHSSTWQIPPNLPSTKPHETEEVRKHLLLTPLLNPADQAPAAVVESLLNVRLRKSSLREVMICEDEAEKRMK